MWFDGPKMPWLRGAENEEQKTMRREEIRLTAMTTAAG